MKHYLLIENKKFRVEVNMRTAEAWERLSGQRIGQFEMDAAMAAGKGGVATKSMMLWLYCSLVEGEELEAREFPYTLDELKKVVKPSILTKFAPIFTTCYIGDPDFVAEEVPEDGQKKSQTKSWGFLSFFLLRWVRWVGVLILFTIAVRFIFFKP